MFRKISTVDEDKSLKFLDVDHRTNKLSKGGFYTKYFVKPTAIDRVFVNGSSHHPRSVFKSIIFSESIRLRRLCERDDDYENAMVMLENKCHKSGFNKDLVSSMISITKTWKDRFTSPTPKKVKCEQMLVWATYFPQIMKLLKREKELNPYAIVTYKRPGTLGAHLTNYRLLAHNSTNSGPGMSLMCKHCKLCGKYGGVKMVEETTTATSQSGKCFKLQRRLTCKDFGIYVATCRLCRAQYVGQTSTSFSERWSGHRSFWKSGSTEEKDQAALRIHYNKHHPEEKAVGLAEAFGVTFVDQPKLPKDLDVLESDWVNRLDASININKTTLPKIR